MYSNLIFLVLIWVNRCVFLRSDLLRVLVIHLSYCLSIGLFCYVHLVALFLSKIVRFLLHSVVGMFSFHLPQLGRIFFRCFRMSCFVCIVLPFVDIFLIFLLSSGLFGLFHQVVLLFFLVVPFPFCPYMFKRVFFVLSFWSVFVDFLFLFPVEFRFLVLIFSSCFLRGYQFSHKLISLLHRLVHLIRLYYLLM